MRLIDADELISQAFTTKQGYDAVSLMDIVDAPTVDIEPVKYGRWYHDRAGRARCSVCNEHEPNGFYRYCPHCGARMKNVD